MKNIFALFLLVYSASVFAQTTVSAVVYDYGMNCDNLYQNRTGQPSHTSPSDGANYSPAHIIIQNTVGRW